MFHLATSDLLHLLMTYGYLAVLVFVGIESIGIPFPGETMLLIAAIYAGATHRLFIAFVIVAAACGAILGDNIGFWIGREGGSRLVRRYGHYIGLDERKLKLGLYLVRLRRTLDDLARLKNMPFMMYQMDSFQRVKREAQNGYWKLLAQVALRVNGIGSKPWQFLYHNQSSRAFWAVSAKV